MKSRRALLVPLGPITLFTLLALVGPSARALTPTNWIESDGLRYAGRIDVGRVTTGEEVRAHLVLENKGSVPLWIERLSPTCGCTVVDWTPAHLLPGTTKRPEVRLDAYDLPGHHRHLVRILGADERALGDVVVTADAIDALELPSGLVVDTEFVEIGPHRPGQRLRVEVPVRNTGDRSLLVDWSWRLGPDTLASSSTGTPLAPHSTGRLALHVDADRDLWGSKLLVSGYDEVIEIPVRGHWAESTASGRARSGPLALEGAATRGDELVVDFGELQIGEPARRAVRLTNRGVEVVRLQRAFTSSDRDLAIAVGVGALEPGASTEVTVEHRGLRGPGSFRAFVHLIFDGMPAVRLVCRGYVHPVRPASDSSTLRTVELVFDRRDPSTVLVHDPRRESPVGIRTLDHASYVRVLTGSDGAAGSVCTNCEDGDAHGLLASRRLHAGGIDLDVYAVLGDERFGSEHPELLPRIAEPNGTVIRILHPEHSDTRHSDAVPVVVFHDDFPLVEEAARRTRVSGVFVTAASTGPAPRVVTLRDVLVLDPGAADGATDVIRLRLHVKDQQILHWELLEPERSRPARGEGA